MRKIILAASILLCLIVPAQRTQKRPTTYHRIIYFNFKEADLKGAALVTLDSVVRFIKSDSVVIMGVEIEGHCDSVGRNERNDKLSVRRAKAVRDYLAGKGVPDSLITSVEGFGKRKPLNNNADSAERAANRRAEIKVAYYVRSRVPSVLMKKVPALMATGDTETIDLSKAAVNDIIALHDINFYPNRHVILEGSMKEVRTLFNTMVANPNLRIEIRGHVCCLPDYQGDAPDEDTYTQDLSLQRAHEIYLYMKENGIDSSRMTYIGLGGKFPLVKEFTERDKMLNRRVEIRILSK